MTAQVFGPDRPDAARDAIAELEQAQRALVDLYGGWAPVGCKAERRLKAAREVRARYSEYGDTFVGH